MKIKDKAILVTGSSRGIGYSIAKDLLKRDSKVIFTGSKPLDIYMKDKVIDKVNQARIRAENKECCQVIQERYIEKRISEDGLNFIYEEHPKIISCSDEYNYKGVGIIG